MASAAITFDQSGNPIPVGQPGRARDDLLVGIAVQARNADDTGVNRWRWSLRDRPLGSTATLSSTTAAAVTFVPDIPGSYLLTLSVNDGLVGEVDPGRVAGVRDGFGRLYPATPQDKNASDWDVGGSPNKDGWGKEVEAILRAIGVPQLLEAAQQANVAKSASENVTIAAIGLPSSSAQVTAYDFVDIKAGGNTGSAPTVNGESFLEVLGENGLASICTVTVDLDTSGTTVADEWALVMISGTTPLLLARLTII